jgi:hypothetical protein
MGKCKDCKYFSRRGRNEQGIFRQNTDASGKKTGWCQRQPPGTNGWPTVPEHEGCGEYIAEMELYERWYYEARNTNSMLRAKLANIQKQKKRFTETTTTCQELLGLPKRTSKKKIYEQMILACKAVNKQQ